jgi:acyl-CoA hydrolase
VADIDWPRWLRPGDRLVASHMSAEPAALLASMAACTALPQPLHLMLGVPFTQTAATLPPGCELTTYGGMGSAAAIAGTRTVRMSPQPYSRSAQLYEEGAWHCDVALVSLGRAADGRLFLAPSHGAVIAAARRARHVIAQVSQNVPCLPGAEWPEDLAPDAVLETDAPPSTIDDAAPGEVESAVARQVAELVPDGACLQVGIGALPSALLQALAGHRNLGVHTGMMTDALHRLVVAGVADGSRKSVDRGLAVTGSVCGTASLYGAVIHEPGPIVLRQPGETHALAPIARLDDMLCLNSAIEVDLLGNVNAEAVVDAQGRRRYVGGVGGLPDFVRGALAARRGQSVIALASRTARGQPRIVARLSGPCTVAAADADLVATEHGVARLRNATLDERVRGMLAVADPQDHDGLTVSAREMGLL